MSLHKPITNQYINIRGTHRECLEEYQALDDSFHRISSQTERAGKMTPFTTDGRGGHDRSWGADVGGHKNSAGARAPGAVATAAPRWRGGGKGGHKALEGVHPDHWGTHRSDARSGVHLEHCTQSYLTTVFLTF